MQPGYYHRFSRWLHWLIGGLIIFMIFLGWRLGDHDTERLSRISLHKSIGIMILGLTALRILLRLTYKAPEPVAMPRWQAVAAQTLHIAFYFVMIAMPLTGWAMVSTSIRPIPFFGMFTIPHLPVGQAHETHEVFELIHGLIAKLLFYAMIPLHVGAALKHHFVDKDAVVEHMVPGLEPGRVMNWRWMVPAGVVLAATLLGFGVYGGRPDNAKPPEAAPAPSPPQDMASDSADQTISASSSAPASAETVPVPTWKVVYAKSRIGFATSFEGEAVTGGFNGYSAVIRFDPDRLDTSRVRVTIDLATVGSGDQDRDTTLKSASFFDIAANPNAMFEARSFTRKDAIHFVAHGRLTLHGTTRPLDLPFSLTIKDNVATMAATASVDRTAYGVGSGDYASTASIPAAVKIDIALTATRAE